MNIKIELLMLGKKQVDLIPVLEERGIKTMPSDISAAINEGRYYHQPRMVKIRTAILEIIEEWKKGA